MQRMIRKGVLLFAATVTAVGCGGGDEEAVTPATATPAPQPTPGRTSTMTPGGGSSLLIEQMQAISIQNQLAEQQAQSDAAARVSGSVAKDKIRGIAAEREDQMNAVFDTLDDQ